MHNGFVRVNDEKMSKSLGNFFTVRDVLKTLRDPEVLRLFLLSSHYRGPINYSEAQLASGGRDAARPVSRAQGRRAGRRLARDGAAMASFDAAMDDDFNTPEALAVLQGVAREFNSAKAAGRCGADRVGPPTLRAMGAMLGVLQQDPEAVLEARRGAGDGADSAVI